MSATSKGKPLTQVQFWIVVVAMAVSGVAALVALANVAGAHGRCPTATQISRPAAAQCWPAYLHQANPTDGVVG